MKNRVKVGVNSKKKQEKVCCMPSSLFAFPMLLSIQLADAEKLEYDSDNGGQGKKKSGGGGGGGTASKKRSPIVSKKRPAHSPPPTNGKRKKR